MNAKQFEYVLALAKKGNFSRAADELGVSQPSLSQYIKRLETELGVILFDRNNGDVRLTEAGKVFIRAGRNIIDTERQMKNQFVDLAQNTTGSLVVGIAPTRCQYLMPEAVKRFHELFPGMHLIVEERFLGSILEDAEQGAFDLCVATLPVDSNVFSFELMMREEVILAVPKKLKYFEVLEKTQKTVKDRLFPAIDITRIAGAPYVFLSDNQPTQVHLNHLQAQYGFHVETAVKCMSIETQYSMIKAGVGLALLPSSLAKYNADNSIGYFSLMQEIPIREIAVIYRKGQYLSKAATALKTILTSL